ncbi:MAG: hypothetical protein LBK96_04280 [Prevotellaceae bacterium]|jgi:hypothetical protein|nr:hypothetical protein [Prevotellaceae bacterium]
MKKILLLLIMSALTAATVYAQDATIRSKVSEKFRRIFVEGGIGAYVPDDACFQVMFSAGYYLSPNNRLSLDFSAGSNDKEIGYFDYYVTTNGRREHFTDGVLNRKYTFRPILLSWGHEFRLSEKLKLRAGPSIGINRISAADSYTAESHDLTGMTDTDGSRLDKHADKKSAFAGAATIALEWRLFEPSGIGFAYKLLANKAINFEDAKLNAVSHQIGVTYWWKF